MLKHGPFEQVRAVFPIPAPIMVRSLVTGIAMTELHVAVPGGMAMESPLTAAATQASTDDCDASVAINVGLLPLQIEGTETVVVDSAFCPELHAADKVTSPTSKKFLKNPISFCPDEVRDRSHLR